MPLLTAEGYEVLDMLREHFQSQKESMIEELKACRARGSEVSLEDAVWILFDRLTDPAGGSSPDPTQEPAAGTKAQDPRLGTCA